MSGPVSTWHYGVVAQWWAEFNVGGPELDCFRTIVERHGQPVLDLACGAGRLLAPYLQAGVDVDGCDVSPDMLECCRAATERDGTTPNLYAQAMHELDLPRTYRTIYICSSFGLGGDRTRDQEALRRIYRHLEPGGVLAMDNHQPYIDVDRWKYWLADHRTDLPEPFPEEAEPRPTSDGSALTLRAPVRDFDPWQQIISYEMQGRRYRDGELVDDELYRLDSVLYFSWELRSMLQLAGFDTIEVYDGYELAPQAKDSTIPTYVAHKPAS